MNRFEEGMKHLIRLELPFVRPCGADGSRALTQCLVAKVVGMLFIFFAILR
jgi:hypothetical protein